jgi:hypothetical protein
MRRSPQNCERVAAEFGGLKMAYGKAEMFKRTFEPRDYRMMFGLIIVGNLGACDCSHSILLLKRDRTIPFLHISSCWSYTSQPTEFFDYFHGISPIVRAGVKLRPCG